ncbi:unnamed protein product, partial [Linum tenue]
MIGLLASIRRPELFSKLILIGASPRIPRKTENNSVASSSRMVDDGNGDSHNSFHNESCFSWFLNDKDYHGGYEQSGIEEVFTAMEANYEAWVQGFAPLAVGADVPAAVREFTRTLFNMRPDITLFVSRQVEARRPIMAVDAVGVEDVEEVVDVRVEGGVAVEVE